MKRTLQLLLIAAAGLPAAADVLSPIVAASIHDEPRDGLGDSFNNSPFEGLLREQSTREDRAILEYDVTAYAGATVTSAVVAGRVDVNNSYDNGPRTFDFSLYDGNGQADLSDFQIPSVVVGSGSYHPPNDSYFEFSFDVTAEVQTLISGGAAYIGFKADCTSDPNFPNILSGTTTLTIEAEACPPDYNGDGVVNSQDFIAFLNDFVAGNPGADYNGDGVINSQDFIAFLNDFVAGC